MKAIGIVAGACAALAGCFSEGLSRGSDPAPTTASLACGTIYPNAVARNDVVLFDVGSAALVPGNSFVAYAGPDACAVASPPTGWGPFNDGSNGPGISFAITAVQTDVDYLATDLTFYATGTAEATSWEHDGDVFEDTGIGELTYESLPDLTIHVQLWENTSGGCITADFVAVNCTL
ncbi:MAG TPA: hypothetical protein VG389_27835 [Myxococcota bacterium]|jgi:hypothetical protein|nr:hypothetical protein [Myxococcota bacterium]